MIRNVFLFQESKLYSAGFFFFFPFLLAYLYSCFFGGVNFTHVPFPSLHTRTLIFRWVFSHCSKDTISQLPLDCVRSCDEVPANGE